MKITVISVGSQGDVQPYIALGLGLQQAGLETALIAELGKKIWDEDGVCNEVLLISKLLEQDKLNLLANSLST